MHTVVVPHRGAAHEAALQGDFGETWLEVVAAGAGLLHGRPASLDRIKADIQLTAEGLVGDTRNPTVLVQVKTTVDLRRHPDGSLRYDLDVQTYDVLRQVDHSVRRILVVIGLERDGERVRLAPDGTLLLGRGGWVSLEGRPETVNRRTVSVRLPADNTVDPVGLRAMLAEYGVRRSTPVPDLDPWEEDSP